MEEGSINHQNGGQMGPQAGAIPNNKQNDESNPKAQYSIPGILHFIQHEWARFELERSQWEVDKAELQVLFSIIIAILFNFFFINTRRLHLVFSLYRT